MGSHLSKPVTSKESTLLMDEQVCVGVSCMQGWRAEMEDAHLVQLDLEEHRLFGVFDGHGGDGVAAYCRNNFASVLRNLPEFKEKAYEAALRKAYILIDQGTVELQKSQNWTLGSTAILALYTPSKELYVANVGDSRAVLCRRGNPVALSTDHKPLQQQEHARIVAAGGFVHDGRTNGDLAMSRAMGDHLYKNNPDLNEASQILSCIPDIKIHQLTASDEFLILACDGIWDCVSNKLSVQFVKERISAGMSLQLICEELMDYCLSDRPGNEVGTDNMTVVIVQFKKLD